MQWIQHHNPELVITDSKGKEKERIDMNGYDTKKIEDLLKRKGCGETDEIGRACVLFALSQDASRWCSDLSCRFPCVRLLSACETVASPASGPSVGRFLRRQSNHFEECVQPCWRQAAVLEAVSWVSGRSAEAATTHDSTLCGEGAAINSPPLPPCG